MDGMAGNCLSFEQFEALILDEQEDETKSISEAGAHLKQGMGSFKSPKMQLLAPFASLGPRYIPCPLELRSDGDRPSY
jgi:hypothetical protein